MLIFFLFEASASNKECTSIHDVVVNTVFSGFESSIDSEGVSENNIFLFSQ